MPLPALSDLLVLQFARLLTNREQTRLGTIELYDERIDNNRLKFLIKFMPLNREEVDLIQQAVNKVGERCCRNSNRPLNKIIGYVRLK